MSADFLRLQRADEKPADFDVSTIKVFLQRAGDDGYPYQGYMDYVDPEVDKSTGTLGVVLFSLRVRTRNSWCPVCLFACECRLVN